MQCPQCDARLKLVMDTTNKHAAPKVLRGFRVIDLLGLTGLVAIHLIAFPIIARVYSTWWVGFFYFSPTVVTCVIHLRLRLSVRAAVIVHYALALIWAFLDSLGQTVASNKFNENSHIDLWPHVLGVTVDMAVFSIASSAVYGMVCWCALSANRTEMKRTATHAGQVSGGHGL